MSVDDIKIIGIIGAGQMGSGIATVAATSGYDAIMMDINEAQLEKGMAKIEHNLSRQLEKGLINDDERKAAMARIKTATTMNAFKDCDIIIEAASEDEKVKTKILKELFPLLKPDAIITTNTSSISITRLAAQTDRPKKFAGMHFMNPVPAMELVEVIRGINTDKETFDTVSELAKKMKKIPAAAEDFPAFIVNRILMPMLNEAVYTLYEGVGTVKAIDESMMLGAHHPMGPLALSDFIGLDVCLAVMNTLYEDLADSKYRPCPLLTKYVEAGWLGRKSGKGFYDYSGDEPVPTR